MIRENQRLLNQFNVLTDAVAVFLAMLASYWLRFDLFRGIKGMPFNYYVWLGVVAAALTLLIFAVAGLYESFRAVRLHVEAGRVAVLELLVALIIMAAMFVLRLGETSRWSVAFFYGVSVLLLVGKRAALRLLLRRYRTMGYNQKRVLLVGHGESAEAYLKKVTQDKSLGYQVVGYVADRSDWRALPYCGAYRQLEEVFQREKPDEVVVTLPTEEGQWMGKIIDACEKDGTKLSVVPSYVRYMSSNPQVDIVNGLPLINLRRIPLDNLGNAMLKRTADIIGSLVLIVLTSPLMLIAAIGVKLSSPGPIIFRQERVGKDKKPFYMYKFRSMTDARGENGELLPDEVRLTKFGRALRSTSLDELPELWNIFKGDMSIVGPRPQLVRDMVFMTPEQRLRHTVMPGLTGLAQVSGRNAISWEDKLAADLRYIRQITFLGDVKIVLLTVRKVFFREDISADGMDTAEDLGDYLLRTAQVSEEAYQELQEESRELLIAAGK